jgi:hypothetical protein
LSGADSRRQRIVLGRDLYGSEAMSVRETGVRHTEGEGEDGPAAMDAVVGRWGLAQAA